MADRDGTAVAGSPAAGREVFDRWKKKQCSPSEREMGKQQPALVALTRMSAGDDRPDSEKKMRELTAEVGERSFRCLHLRCHLLKQERFSRSRAFL